VESFEQWKARVRDVPIEHELERRGVRLHGPDLAACLRPNSDDWIGKEIELFLGQVEFQKKTQEAVLVRPVLPPLKPSTQTKSKDGDGAMNDETPF